MKIIENLIDDFSNLSGVGKKTATRYAYELLKMNKENRESFISNLEELDKVKLCEKCHGYSQKEICEICQDNSRNNKTLIIVSEAKDIDKIESVMSRENFYFVLGGVIDPLNGTNIHDLNIEHLKRRVLNENIQELIFVLPASNEGELTSAYIKNKINNEKVLFTKLAQGIPIGGDLEYLDELTLLKSIQKRQQY